MNAKQLSKLGVPANCMKEAIATVQEAAKQKLNVKPMMKKVAESPESFINDPVFGYFAQSLIADRDYVAPEPISYKTWGTEIEESAHSQMRDACSLPNAVAAALMPDAHQGYGICIGGVLALQNAVSPAAVGVDIACRMKMSLIDMPVNTLKDKFNLYKEALERGTRFGIGESGRSVFPQPKNHPVMDEDWGITKCTAAQKDKAWKQLGTSGSGNHFCEFGVYTSEGKEYVAVLSHSGSRGPGSAVCTTYSDIAQARLATKHKHYGRLAWLDMDTEAGQEYWEAMNLMGRYAAANHELIHSSLAKLLGADILWTVENHHNFAWLEDHPVHGKVVVHRKGATPAQTGVLGVIPGSMGTPAFVVEGKGNPDSLFSASHGAGRCMSRTQGKAKYSWKAVQNDLEKKGIIVLAGAADEVPGVYKDIHSVMEAQADLVSIRGQFDPKIVLMCGDGSKSED